MVAQRQPRVAVAGIDAAPHDRRYELDWLRALVVLCVICYHVVGIFAAGTTLYLHDGGSALHLDAPSIYFNAWAIPLLFAIAGASSLFSLRQRGVGAYLVARVLRLVVPFLFGTLVLVPIQVYGVLLSDPSLLHRNLVPIADAHLLDSYPRFYLQYLLGYWYFLGHYSSQVEFIFWGHLWFIARLIACAVLVLPLLLLLNSRPGKWVTGLVARALRWPPAILAPGLLLGAAVLVLRQPWARPPLGSWASLDWAQFGVLVICYFVGSVLYADYRSVRAIQRGGLLALALGIVTFGLLLLLDAVPLTGPVGITLERMTEGMVAWLWVVTFLSVGTHYLARPSRVLPYLTEGSYSFYVLHMPVLVAVAALVLPLQVPIAAKIALLLVGTLTLTLSVYTLVVRRFAVTRFLLGVHLAPIKERGPISRPAAVRGPVGG